MATPITPFIVYGTATDKTGTVIANQVVTLLNNNSSETQIFTTNSSGQYVFDCANFTSGWNNGDKLTLSVGIPSFEIYVSHNGSNSWYQIDNEEEYSFDINSIKVKVDQTNHPGGRQITIVKG